MWTGQPLSRPCLKWACACWKNWTRHALLISGSVLLVTVQGCSFPSSTRDMAPLPVLPSLQRMTLNGEPGVWMDDADAGRLAAWLYDVTGVAGHE